MSVKGHGGKGANRMDDLISRQAVIDMWRQKICYDRTCHARDEGRCTETFCDFKLFEYQINHMPSVKPQEKTGHWIWQTEDIYQCSECGEDIHVKEVMNEPQYAWCPMCGCPMEIER